MTPPNESGPVAVGSDHAGFPVKETIKTWLRARGFEVSDFGTPDETSVDYPDVGRELARAVARGEPIRRGVLVCGSGLGMSYVANRVPGVRAALCWSVESARLAREHNDANVLVLPGRIETMDDREAILDAWLGTPFSGEARHSRRIAKIEGEAAD